MADELIEFRTAFRSAQVASNNVDLEARTITNVVLAEVGEAKGRGYYFEKVAFQKFVETANKKYPEGLPSNYGHNWNNLGKGLGRFSNLRLSGNKILADLSFYEAADQSPTHPGMATYVMKMAKEDPKSLMCSIKIVKGEYYQYDKSKSRIRVKYYDEDWNWIPAHKEYGKVYLDIEEARGCDIVDDGALTSSIYSSTSINHTMGYLSSLPEFGQWVEDHIESIPEICDHFATKSDQGVLTKIKKFFSMNTNKPEAQAPDAPATPETPAPAAPATEADQFAAFNARLDALAKENADLKAQIAQLSTEPAVEETGGAAEAAETDTGDPAWMSLSVNQKAAASFARSKPSN